MTLARNIGGLNRYSWICFRTLYDPEVERKGIEKGEKKKAVEISKYLNVQSLEEKSKEENILPEITEPTLEEKYISLLKECVKELFVH